MKTLDIINYGFQWKACFFSDFFIDRQFHELKHFGAPFFFITDGGLFKGFDPTYHIGGLLYGAENIAHPFYMVRLDISVCDQDADCSSGGVSGTYIALNQVVLQMDAFKLWGFHGSWS